MKNHPDFCEECFRNHLFCQKCSSAFWSHDRWSYSEAFGWQPVALNIVNMAENVLELVFGINRGDSWGLIEEGMAQKNFEENINLAIEHLCLNAHKESIWILVNSWKLK